MRKILTLGAVSSPIQEVDDMSPRAFLRRNLQSFRATPIDPITSGLGCVVHLSGKSLTSGPILSWPNRGSGGNPATSTGVGVAVGTWVDGVSKCAAFTASSSPVVLCPDAAAPLVEGQGSTLWCIYESDGTNNANLFSMAKPALRNRQFVTGGGIAGVIAEVADLWNGTGTAGSSTLKNASRKATMAAHVRTLAENQLPSNVSDGNSSYVVDGRPSPPTSAYEMAYLDAEHAADHAWIGSNQGIANYLNGKILALGVHTVPLSVSQLVRIAAYEGHLDINVACLGDSITANSFGLKSNGYPAQINALMGANLLAINNLGVGGTRPRFASDQYNDNTFGFNYTPGQPWLSGVHGMLRPGAANILTIFDGTNDIYYGIGTNTGSKTATQVIGDLQALTSQAIADGWIVITLTCLPRSAFNSTQNAARVALNAAITANVGGVFGLVYNVGDESNLQNTADTGYYRDGTHPTDGSGGVGDHNGLGVVAVGVKRLIDAVVNNSVAAIQGLTGYSGAPLYPGCSALIT